MTVAAATLRKMLRWLSAYVLMFFFLGSAQAETTARATIERIEPLVIGGQLSLDIDIDLTLNTSMKQALSRGVPLYFSIDLEIEQPRWWWLNKSIVDTRLERRLSYNTLTRSWRVSTGDLAIAAASYEDAINLLARIRDWPVVLSDRFEQDQQYIGEIRIRLDVDRLARPLQMDNANRDNWTLNSPWKSFEFSIRRDTGVAQ
ncbi:DUF4390 domain-containing protein [Orrella daihaiensis]|uniref:DUF4390 domain-containing protein n=1 Tax=Orrella daihaiensis TaxID=2782176 RepID=A0ABY4AND7_9BURK|nr:DUF4390 domain-containing protein [Orrella daihaiensis]UOD50572.1 DUF4390 domain-containing protein [Orrella daihaiensis]